MKRLRPFGLFVLGNPLLVDGSSLRLRDRCYVETISLAREFVPRALIVARTRPQENQPNLYPTIEDSGAELTLPLPDYGCGGMRGVFRALNILFNSSIRRSLKILIEQADFIYIENTTSPEVFLTVKLAKRARRHLIFEMRADIVLNLQYMYQRFGPIGGGVLFALHHIVSAYVRRQCLAGLYINNTLLRRYPITGTLQKAISDAYLPDDFHSSPRNFVKPARRYLYVGHLETVKRVDLILKALHTVRNLLPEGWHFDIIGSGPLEAELRSLTSQLGLAKHVTFHGYVIWGEALFCFYQNADLLLIASTSESGPRTLVEAMAFGLPVISTYVGVAPDLLDKSVLTPVGNIRAYADCLAKLVMNPFRLTELSERNRIMAQGFWRSILVAQRYRFLKQAIDMSRQQLHCSDCPASNAMGSGGTSPVS